MENKKEAPFLVGGEGASKVQNKITENQGCTQNIPEVFRVGDKIFEKVLRYDVNGNGYIAFEPRRRDTIADKFGRDFLKTIPSYDAAVIVPSHNDYKQTIGKCWNLYQPLDASPQNGTHKTWDKMIRHIFGGKEALGWDYLTLAYREPTQLLPVLALVSPENQTGKTTFGKALSFLFGRNVGFYSQDDLSSQFNSWIKSLFAVFEEISDAKRSLNKIKDISTAQNATLNEKYMPPVGFQPFVKIVILSNNHKDFIHANENDIRYWILRLHPFAKGDFDPKFNDKLRQEVPAVMYTLSTREMSTECKSRMWFDPNLLKTEALKEVIENSYSPVAKDIQIWAKEVMDQMPDGFGATIKDVCEALNNKYARYDIQKAMKEELKLPTRRTSYKNWRGEYSNGQAYFFGDGGDMPPFGSESVNTM